MLVLCELAIPARLHAQRAPVAKRRPDAFADREHSTPPLSRVACTASRAGPGSPSIPLVPAGRLWVRAVRAQPERIRDIPDALAVGLFVIHGVAGPLADGFAFPLRNRGHDIDHQ